MCNSVQLKNQLFPLACVLAFRKTREKICPVLDLGSGPYYLVESRFLALTPIKNAPNQVELTQTLLSDEINWLAKFHRVALGRGEAALRTLLVLPKPPVSRQASDYAHEIEKSSAVLQATVDNISQKVERASSRLDKRLKNFARDCENFRNSKP